MIIRIRLFSVLRRAAGMDELTIDIPAGCTAAEAFALATGEVPALKPFAGTVLFALNEQWAPAESALSDGDVLAIMPPVSGG